MTRFSISAASPHSSPLTLSSSLPTSNGFASAAVLSNKSKGFGAKLLGPCLLVIKDTENSLFGAYMNQYIRPTLNHYGSFDKYSRL